MRVLSQPAIVLHARRWRETSLLLELFTHEHGRVGAVARGVTGAKKQALRASLQPLQRLRVDYVLRGELAHLLHAEPGTQAPKLAGDALFAGFYLDELLLRVLPRHDAHPRLFLRFAAVLEELAGCDSLAWTLRRFERDLLDELGYAVDLHNDAEGAKLDADARYRIDPERRALRVRDDAADAGIIRGAALLALAGDSRPSDADLREQRKALRVLLAHHLGARGLHSWGLLTEMARLLPPPTSMQAGVRRMRVDPPDQASD